METKEILKFCLEKGFLLDKDILALFSESNDVETSKRLIEDIGQQTQKKIITKKIFYENKDQLSRILLDLPKDNHKLIESLKIQLGLSIEISKEVAIPIQQETQKDVQQFENVKIVSAVPNYLGRKIEVKDFVNYFRNRFTEMKKILQERNQLSNLVSIDKIYGNRQGISLIGIVLNKRVTKNGNILFEIEDMTGKVLALVNKNKQELYNKADELALDAVVGLKCSGNREIVYINDIIFPEAILFERKKSPVEELALFTGDLHIGSKKFLEENFLRFIDYLNGKLPNTQETNKIKYLFLVGDIITGVGNYPAQEKDLAFTDLESQFEKAAELLGKIRQNIKIIISPGNHDGVRLMEPQPFLDEKYAWPLYNLKNVILTANPAMVNIGAQKNFPGFDVLTYHGFSYTYYANNIGSLMQEKAMNNPEKIIAYLLKNRHLAPTHSSVQYSPTTEDVHIVKKIPDIFFSGHVQKSAVSYFNNILTISGSCWESMTAYQEKFGNTPDHCKVPIFNLKTRAIKILDFE